MNYPKFLNSSVNPEQLALTVKGILVGIIPIVLVVFGLTHVNVGQEELNAIVDGIVQVIVIASSLASAVMFVWGLVRKVFVKIGWVKPVV